MNEEKIYLLLLKDIRHDGWRRKILIKDITSFMKRPLNLNSILIDATKIIKEEGHHLTWVPLFELRSYEGIELENIIEFDDLDSANLFYEIH